MCGVCVLAIRSLGEWTFGLLTLVMDDLTHMLCMHRTLGSNPKQVYLEVSPVKIVRLTPRTIPLDLQSCSHHIYFDTNSISIWTASTHGSFCLIEVILFAPTVDTTAYSGTTMHVGSRDDMHNI